jgi:uncharacterized RDD family membrane protein YckC
MNPMRIINVVDPTDVLWKRVGAFLIDEVLCLLGVGMAWRLFGGWLGISAALAAAVLLFLGVFVVMQGTTGATPGKHLCGLRVVTADGQPCGTGKAAVRSAAWIVDAFPYVLPLTGYAAAFGDRQGQRLGDRAAGTYVIDKTYLGQPPVAVAFPADGTEPYRLTTRAPYLPGTAVNPLKQGTYAGAVAAVSRQASDPAAALGASPHPPAIEPVFDPELNRFKRWDAVHGTWTVFDEDARQWERTPVAP